MIKSLHFWRVWLPPHLIVVLGFTWFSSPAAWFAAFVFYCLISGLGVAVGLHRYFSHKSFETNAFWQQAMLYFGGLACHGHALFWIALHRGLHHRFADTDRDPHSPVSHGLWTAYQGYAFDPTLKDQVSIRAGVDFLRHKEWQWSVTHYHKVLWGTWLLVGLTSIFVGPWLLLSLALAQVWAIHQEAVVNVLGHVKGFGAYRQFDTKDESVNRPLLGLITWGQALHNNHHANAGSPNFGTRWYEPDPSMLWISAIRS